MTDPVREVVDQHYDANKAYLQAKAYLDDLEDERKIVFSEAVMSARRMEVAPGGKPISMDEAEHIARISESYKEIFKSIQQARKLVAAKQAEADYLERRWETWRSREASRRAAERG